ncbi:hypothetical protein F5887DRAFT_42720 [Amanita rubescens]|nr:hypothetical protein F5887DRAFT_182223 [Amanita rubescens]KAF8332554.1 hypothetical protein F5887DRAFT_42720 [Amanita rubescens]
MSLDIGSRCSFPSCGTIDFLPILCRCNKHYCRYHAVPESHSCPADPSDQQPLAPLGDAIPCCVPGCKRPCATESTQVEQARTTYRFAEPYCIVHGLSSSRQSSELASQTQTTSNNIENARALLAKHFPGGGLSHKVGCRQTRRNVPTDRILLMQMRHNAMPGDPRYSASSPKPDELLYLRVQVSPKAQSMFWFKKDLITGKVLDLLASRLNLRTSDESPLSLVFMDDTSVPPSRQILRNDLPISQQVCDNGLLIIG